jgi:serine protease AprX
MAMEIRREWFEQLIFRGAAARRFTQDSPVLPDVWLEYAQSYPKHAAAADLILTPHRDASAAQLAHALRLRLARDGNGVPRRKVSTRTRRGTAEVSRPDVAYHLSSVVARIRFEQLVRVVLPLSAWWHDTFKGPIESLLSSAVRRHLSNELRRVGADARQRTAAPVDATSAPRKTRRKGGRPSAGGERTEPKLELTPDLLWTIRIVGTILLAARTSKPATLENFEALTRQYEELVDAFADLVSGVLAPDEGALLWTVSRNRQVTPAVARSALAVKADAARRLFEIDTRNITWAVIDTGIDARHPAFRRRPKPGVRRARRTAASGELEGSRVVRTFDFTHIRQLLNPDLDERPTAAPLRKGAEAKRSNAALEEQARDLTRRLKRGAAIDWDSLHHFLEVPHDDRYQPPPSEHGTHVAGILAGNWERTEEDPAGPPESLVGMCPDLEVYDFRVFDANERGDEFTVMAALQFIRHLNAHREHSLIQGANLSLSLRHDVANYACGRTPVCEECERVVSSGVVVVAAAGNEGYLRFTTPGGDAEGYRSISISDPGNAEAVITVGATHRYQPHTYGVSYFSSRGPTGDGRIKPDLVAPGEKITAPVPESLWATKDGTSMAAPHVSGAAALLLARHRELIGRPQRVKEILCATATDLGRERYFQGSGMVDVLRALQAV